MIYNAWMYIYTFMHYFIRFYRIFYYFYSDTGNIYALFLLAFLKRMLYSKCRLQKNYIHIKQWRLFI